MKNKLLIFLLIDVALLIIICCTSNPNNASTDISSDNLVITEQIAEVSCGQCMFKLSGKGCDLAIKLDGKAYYVDGSNIDDHGDAHAADGFCNAIRKATVKGSIVEGRFQSDYIKLIK